MKRRSLFKRFVSGFMAFALAATVCFDGNLLTPLRANADGEIQTVNVNFYDNDVKSLCVNEEGDNTNYRYFVLGALVDKDADTDIAATKDYVDQFVAWDCKEIFPKTQTDSIATFDTFYEWGSDYQSTADRSKNTVTYNSEKHRFIARVYRYWVTGDVDYNPLNTTASVEPTNLVAPVGEKETKINVTEYYEGNTVKFNEQSSDTFPGYVPSKTDDVDCINVRFDKQNVEFALNINFSDKTTIKADEYIYALVEVEHQNSPTTYYLKQLVCNNAESLTFTVQDSTNRNWTDENQNALPNEQYHGNEKSTTLRVFKAAKECNIGNLIKGENCTELFSGNFLKAQKLDISEIEKSGDNIVTKYSVTVNFLAPASSDNYNFRDILGSGIAFGITADRFALRNHAQTNFATNYYRDLLRTTTSSQGQNIDPDLASETAGEIYVGNFALLAKDPYYLTNEPDPDPDPQAPKPSVDPDPTNITADPNGRLVVGNPQVPLVIRTPDINKVVTQTPELVTLTNKEADGETEVTASSVKNKVVDPIITQMQQMSGRLASKSATVTPVVGESHITVDTLDYPDNATVYVDGDALAVNGVFQPQNMTFKFIKKENQTIVINFKTTKYVTIDEFYLEVTKKGTGEVIEGNSMPDGGRLSEKNQWLDQQVMRRIVWNLRGAVNTEEEFAADTPCVTIRNTAGLFLIPNAQTVTHVPSTSTGWLVSAGYVENNGGEWHFPFSELEGYEAPKETEVTISKKKLIGEDELPGATIRLVDKNTGENIGTTMWENIYDTAKAENPSLAGEFYKMRTNDSVCYGLQWVSGNAPMTLRLRDGAYVLKEWGTKFTYNNEEYTTVTSEFEFEITNGVVTKVSDKIVENSNSSIEYSATNNTFIIRDALTNGPKPVKVNFNKTDIRGEKELNGAVITVYSVNAEGNRTAVSGTTENPNPWTSAIGKTLTLELPDGNYVFTESGTNVTDNDGNVYDVISSEFSFTVSGGIVTSVSENIVTDIENMNENGGALYSTNNSGEAVFTICDAMRKITSGDVKIDKTDITGQAEIAGAKLSLFTDADCTVRAKDAEGKTINEWESDGNGAKTFTLNNGTYYLKETGNDIIIGNKIYKVITSVLKFDVVNGEVSVAAQTGYKTAPDSTDKNGYFLYDSDSNTIKVCDAERTTNVKIDKTDITGQTEIAGAKLSLFTDADCTVRAKDAFGTTINEWESDGNGAKEFILNDGTYYLKETGGEITVGDTVYKVVTSVARFSIENGALVVPAQSAVETAPQNTNTDGYFLYNRTTETIKVCDAAVGEAVVAVIRKGTEDDRLDGAEFEILDSDSNPTGIILNPSKTQDASTTLKEGTYYIEEKSAPAGYEKNKEKIKFTVNPDGTITADIPESYDSGYEFDKETFTFVVKSTYTTRTVTFSKQAASNSEEIDGAKLRISEITADGEKTVEEWVSGTDGNDDNGKLKAHTIEDKFVMNTVYKLVETTAPNGYLMAETIFFKLDANGKVSVSDSANGTFTELDDTTVVMKDELTSVTVSKKDSSGKALTGAKFRIYEEGSSTPVELDLTDVSSDEIRGLKVGVIYTIKEYVTPDKYIPCEDTYFYINKDGSVLYGKTDYTGEMRTATNNTVVIINDMYTEISIGKRDIAGQAPIEGATLGIYTDENCTKLAKDAFGTEIPVWTSKKAKDMEVQLADGTYYLRETSDTSDNVGGYFVSGDVKYRVITSVLEFSVHNGKILETVGTKAELDEDASEGYFYANKSAGLIFVCDAEIVPDKAVVKLTKTDMDGNFVAGAKFTLVSADETVNLNWTSAATDKVKSFELSDGNYTLTETEAAPGYNRIERSVQFSIENGVISVNTDQDAFIESDGGVYTFDSENTLFTSKNTFETYSISINKIDNNKAAVEGAILRVNNSDGSPLVERIETDENGAASVENEFVMNVVYTLVEVDPPVGYLPAESINFKFDENGDLWIQEGRGDFEKQKSNVITMVDEKSSIKISKYEITGQTEISNAKLTIYEADGTTVVKDDEGKDLSWFSVAGSPKELVLPDGSYILAETGDTFDFDGHTYKVTNSTLAFSIVNGKLNIQAQNSLKDELAQEGTKEGYYFYNDTTDTIMLCDAERFTATVTISKKAIGGEAELPGAKLSIYTNENCTERAKDSQGNTINEWTSTGTAKSFTLAEGTYYLKETGDKFTGKIGNKDVEFKVITSVLKFTVDDQGNVTADIDANADKTVNGNGYFDVDASDSNHFIVSDAYTVIPKNGSVKISKTEISGQTEIAGAKLSLFTNEGCTEKAKDSNGTVINEWESGTTAREFSLAAGTYYLKETGDEFTVTVNDEKVTYKVVTSVLKFTVDTDGNVSVPAQDGLKAQADADSEDGYFLYDAESNTIKVCDAENVDESGSGGNSGDNPGGNNGDNPGGNNGDNPGGNNGDNPGGNNGDNPGGNNGDNPGGNNSGDENPPRTGATGTKAGFAALLIAAAAVIAGNKKKKS